MGTPDILSDLTMPGIHADADDAWHSVGTADPTKVSQELRADSIVTGNRWRTQVLSRCLASSS